MERVSGDGFFSYRREVGKKETKGSKRTAAARGFESELQDAHWIEPSAIAPDVSDETAGELLDAVFEAGDRLKHHADADALNRYRDAVRRFLGAVVQRGVGVEERTSGSSVLRRKRYTLVRVIDAKLEQLAAGMIASQRDQLDLLARVDEINGMLVDFSQ